MRPPPASLLLFLALGVAVSAPPGDAAPAACYSGRAGAVRLTSYWVPVEGTLDDSGPLSGPRIVPLKTCARPDRPANVIARVANETSRKCSLEGTCRLADGRLVNVDGWVDGDPHKKCYRVMDPKKFPYGKGSRENPLVPWVSAASDDLPFGTVVFVAPTKGLRVPGTTKRHNGCWRVDDTGIGVYRCWLDLFVSTYGNYVNVTGRLGERGSLAIKDAKNCPVLDYVGFRPILGSGLTTRKAATSTVLSARRNRARATPGSGR
ncbi:hypothetical protein DFJ74DRAFT_693775 [Hyaloraphidium curvatum]|nr:hypothetical protein DFJ74DRAFT_693775 [Hyaloraphidium curvatum]